MSTSIALFSYRRHWAHRFGVAPVLPMSPDEMDALGWDSCDILLVTGDAYVDHPSFGMALIGRLLEAHGFRVGIISQPDWTRVDDFRRLGRPNLFFGITAGNMDSMVNRYTADRRLRSDDAYTPDGAAGRRPDRSVVVYAQRAREAFGDVPIVIGGIEASLRRVAHYDYWSDKVRRSVLVDAKADLLIYGNGERAVVEIAHRLARGEAIGAIRDVRGTGFLARGLPAGWAVIDSTGLDAPGRIEPPSDPYHPERDAVGPGGCGPVARDGRPLVVTAQAGAQGARARQLVRLPAFEQVRTDPVLYAHASRVLHQETNPGNARVLIQDHGDRTLWLNPPPRPLTTAELDRVYELPYSRRPHPAYGGARLPSWEMIRFSVNIVRGCFGGCTFCSITAHEGRLIQSRSTESVLREVAEIRDHTPGFTGIISDLGGPTANMWRLGCRDARAEAACRRLSCLFPAICANLDTDHGPLIELYRRVRAVPGIRRVLIASGLRYDLALRSPDYVRELATHHVGGYLKVAPEHTEPGPLALMMKPGIAAYDRFQALFERFSREAGKEQYLIPYFIAAHPGTTDQDMLKLALWLKGQGLRLDQVQAFLPAPMALATTMYHTSRNPLRRISRDAPPIPIVRQLVQRRLHKAFLRYHDPDNWPALRAALLVMARADLIGRGRRHLVPPGQSKPVAAAGEPARGHRSSRPRNDPGENLSGGHGRPVATGAGRAGALRPRRRT
ncbi:YgiQ family radical SAM protein [Thioalkalicoccus limnaeus]|uniref:YgiQ family radical SAM protein n=1 Tax=Thioalkalicoccus limnaeus TaxID=120681 RepID=A0ABV4BB16_9GAMM